MSIPAGWYPNPDGTPTQRWWDGAAWTAQVGGPTAAQPAASPSYGQPYGQQPAAAQPAAQPVYGSQAYPGVQQLAAPAGTSASTVPFWLFALTPLLSILTFVVFNVGAYMRLSILDSERLATDPTTLLNDMASTGYFNIFALSFGIYAITIVLAAIDRRVLAQRGVPRPFHWAWTFLSPLIYLIGRPVVASRRGAPGSRPIVITYVVAYVVSIVVTIVIAVVQVAPILSELPSY